LRRVIATLDADCSVHGFRSSFRDWASETTAYPSEVVEMALAHGIASQTEAAYRRGDLIQKRTLLMSAWAKHCARPAGSGGVGLIGPERNR
jgi:hypothetical protein